MRHALNSLPPILALAVGVFFIGTMAIIWSAIDIRSSVDRLEAVQTKEIDHRHKIELVMQREIEQHARILYQQSQALKAGERLVKMLESTP